MKKRAFLIHGWEGNPEEGWFPWLRKNLEEKGFEVFGPQLPETATPRIYNWVPAIANAVGVADEQTYFIGHSMGNQAIVRYLESLPEGVKVGGAVFVAGFLKRLTGLNEGTGEPEIAKHWLEAPLNLKKVKSHLPKSVAIFSDDDEYVPLDNVEEFQDILGSKIIIEHKKGHFAPDEGFFELPVVLESVLEISDTK